MEMKMRLNKYISLCGSLSRREADDYILEGLVTINGSVVTSPGYDVREDDWVKVRGKTVRPEKPVYYLFYKPKSMLTTMSDPKGRPCVGDAVAFLAGHPFPVGRLDWHSEGLLLLTNDGEWAHTIMHPSHRITKVYEVKVTGRLKPKSMERLKRGIRLDGKMARMDDVIFLRMTPKGKTWVKVLLHQGKSRQIRRMMRTVGHPVIKLKRIAIGPITLGALKPGQVRPLTPNEVELLRKSPGDAPSARPDGHGSNKRRSK